MKKNHLIPLLVIAYFTVSCSSIFPEPTATPDIAATVAVAAAEIVSQTQTAMPTNTAVPTNTELPTATATEASTPTEVPTVTETPTTVPTITPCYGFWHQGDISKENDGGILINNYSKWDKIIVHMEGTTWKKSFPVYYCWNMERHGVIGAGGSQSIKFGYYSMRVEVPGITTFWTSFQINNTDKTTIEIYDRSAKVIGP